MDRPSLVEFSLPLAPPTGNKEKYGWLARLDTLTCDSRRLRALPPNPGHAGPVAYIWLVPAGAD